MTINVIIFRVHSHWLARLQVQIHAGHECYICFSFLPPSCHALTTARGIFDMHRAGDSFNLLLIYYSKLAPLPSLDDCHYIENREIRKSDNKLYIFHYMNMKKNDSFNEHLNRIIQ
jgi:hypothetical protein